MSKSELVGRVYPVLDHGHVVLMDYMGSDGDIVEAARTSYKKGTRVVSDDRTLIRYLMRHRHTSPLESCQIKLHIKLPIFVERQWARHRTAGWNEVSARYSELPEEYYVPDPENVLAQSKTNKQGREEILPPSSVDEYIDNCRTIPKGAFAAYHADLENGVARELARVNLPLSTYTEKVWWINLHNLLHFLGLRMDAHAQKEIRDYATIIGEQIIAPLFPLVWEAFQDYHPHMGGMLLSRLEIGVIVSLKKFAKDGYDQKDIEHLIPNKREREECLAKLRRLGIIE
jgi:thymidylate synthase (FAD)